MGKPSRQWISVSVGAALLLAALAACSSSSSTPAASAAASTASPAAPSPTASSVETPSAPAGIAWSVPCQEDFSCTGYGEDPFLVTWTPVAGPVDGYVLYYTPGNYDPCARTWTATGDAVKIGSLDAATTNWTGTVSSTNGKFSVVAYNAGGMSAATMSEAVFYMDYTCPED